MQLAHDDFKIVHGIGAAAGIAHINQMHEDARPLDVAQKLRAQAGAGVCALDESGNIGDDEAGGIGIAALAQQDHAEIGLERGEGIIRDLGPGSADARDQRALAHVGIADQADIGQQLEFEAKEALFAAAAQLVLARRLMGGGGEASVAASAAPAASDDDALIGAGKIVQALAGSVVIKDGADGDFEHDVVAFASALIAAFTVASALGLVFRVEAEMHQRVVALAGFHVNVAAAPAIAAGRAAARNELFAAKGDASVAAVAGFYADSGFINEHGRKKTASLTRGPHSRVGCATRSCLIQIFGLDGDVLAQAAAVLEADNAADFGEQGVVFAAADVQAGLNAGSALAHDDGAARHQLAAEGFHAQPLRIAIAPVAR